MIDNLNYLTVLRNSVLLVFLVTFSLFPKDTAAFHENDDRSGDYSPEYMAPAPVGGLSGTYHIGVGIGPGPTPDFTTIKEAIDSLYAVGNAGNIRFELLQETFNERVVLIADSITNYDSTRYIRFTSYFGEEAENGQDIGLPPNGPSAPASPPFGFSQAVITYDAVGSSDNGTFYAHGIYELQILDLHIKALDNSYMQVIRLDGKADDVQISYNILEAKYVNGSSFEQAVIFNAVNDGHYENCTVSDNTILNGSYGIHWSGTTSGIRESNNEFLYNDIIGWNRTGIYVYYQDSVEISSNTIRDNGITNFAYGIECSYVQENTVIEKNDIVNSSTNTAYGIYLQYLKGTSGNKVNIINNSISLLSTTLSTNYGLYRRACAPIASLALNHSWFASPSIVMS